MRRRRETRSGRRWARRLVLRSWPGSVLGLALVAAGLAGCTSTLTPDSPGDSLRADFGEATARNAILHIIDPAPSTATAGPPAFDGARAARAIERYRSGTVVVPATTPTTRFGAGGGTP